MQKSMDRLSWRVIESSKDAMRNLSVKVKERERKEQNKSALKTQSHSWNDVHQRVLNLCTTIMCSRLCYVSKPTLKMNKQKPPSLIDSSIRWKKMPCLVLNSISSLIMIQKTDLNLHHRLQNVLKFLLIFLGFFSRRSIFFLEKKRLFFFFFQSCTTHLTLVLLTDFSI